MNRLIDPILLVLKGVLVGFGAIRRQRRCALRGVWDV